MAVLTEEEFSKHVDTDFRIKLETPEPINLRLVEVKSYVKKDEEHGGMERFSLFFSGPGTLLLPQNTYSLSHDEMGEFDLFFVPIEGTEDGFRYESVFNYFIQPS